MNVLLPVLIVGGIGLVFGLILSVASVLMSVQRHEKTEEILAVLPAANCGGCGYSGCEAYANAIVLNNAKTTLCSPGGNAVSQKIAAILGIQSEEVVPRHAVVRCNGTAEATGKKFDYRGIQSCRAATQLFGGNWNCSYGCLGFGDCVAACKFNAIHVDNGVARVNEIRCTGCGTCVDACPKSLITLSKDSAKTVVLCSNHDAGVATRKLCKPGCIACKLCEKACQYGAITVTNNLASIDEDKCVNCGECSAVCPVKCIHVGIKKAAAI